MPFVKVIKNKAYFKRFQTQYRRRREGKTDYRARRQMILQDKTKFGTPKYRLVARITNKDIISQIVHAKIVGDDVLTAAYAHELPRYGITNGLTNYAAAYATGLLLARRTLAQLKIADKFPGVKEATGEYTPVRDKADDDGESQFPFKAILDIGLARTTTGARIFGVLKGAVDGGLCIPHKPNRFPGYNKEKSELNAKVHRGRIFGAHVAAYMKHVKEIKDSNPDEPNPQFNLYNKNKITPEGLEALYKKAHAAIRADPIRKPKAKAATHKPTTKQTRLTSAARKQNAKSKIAHLRKELGI